MKRKLLTVLFTVGLAIMSFNNHAAEPSPPGTYNDAEAAKTDKPINAVTAIFKGGVMALVVERPDVQIYGVTSNDTCRLVGGANPHKLSLGQMITYPFLNDQNQTCSPSSVMIMTNYGTQEVKP